MSREMKDSGVEWIGEIPENWSTPKVKYHALFFNGDRGKNYPRDDDLQSEGIPFITSNNLHELVLNINPSISKYITNECYNRLGGAKIQLNDILFCLRGSVGICAINKELRDGTVASSLMDVRPVRIDADFLNYYFHSELANAQTIAYMNGSCAANLSAEAVSNYYLLLPNVTEQQQIVHFLDRKCACIDTAIEKTKKSIEKLEEYKKAVITKAVTKGIDPNAKMKDSGVEWIGEIPEGWRVGRIKNSYDVTLGKTLETTNIPNEDVNNYLCAANIKWNGVSTVPQKKMHFSAKEKAQYLLSDGDVLISEGGAAGTSCIYHNELSPCYIQNSVHRCVAIKNSNTQYLYYWMHIVFHSGYINSICHKATIMHYTKEKVEQTPIPILSSTEQQQIVHFLDRKCTAIDTAIEKKKKAIEKWEEYKKSLIYYAVTGKIDCRNEVIE